MGLFISTGGPQHKSQLTPGIIGVFFKSPSQKSNFFPITGIVQISDDFLCKSSFLMINS